ncbi:SelB C-terminal domain-containing protein [Embleya sp. NPDC050154]|uniref:SelB domain-containing protein n=1 Tax=Embleya sp. NPDC050154 TaxID=3363988 RepID=UPI0037A71584
MRAGALFRAADAVLLLPDAPREAMRRPAVLEQPFTVARARAALHTTRRVAMPVLEHLERAGRIRRLPDDRRTVVRVDGPEAAPG